MLVLLAIPVLAVLIYMLGLLFSYLLFRGAKGDDRAPALVVGNVAAGIGAAVFMISVFDLELNFWLVVTFILSTVISAIITVRVGIK
jgi:hypothetical protein